MQLSPQERREFQIMLTQHDLDEMLVKAKEMIEALGIPVPESICPKVKIIYTHSFFGQCCGPTSDLNDSGFDFLIRISGFSLRNSEKSVMNTILHEVLHACAYPEHGHRKKWLKYARLVSEIYGYDIRRCGGDKNESDRENLYEGVLRYVVECPSCGKVWRRQRASNITRHPERYLCKSCRVPLRLATEKTPQTGTLF